MDTNCQSNILARYRRGARHAHERLGWTPHVVEGDDPDIKCTPNGRVMEGCVLEIRAIQEKARKAPKGQPIERPKWPMIILRTPKGWTGPRK